MVDLEDQVAAAAQHLAQIVLLDQQRKIQEVVAAAQETQAQAVAEVAV